MKKRQKTSRKVVSRSSSEPIEWLTALTSLLCWFMLKRANDKWFQMCWISYRKQYYDSAPETCINLGGLEYLIPLFIEFRIPIMTTTHRSCYRNLWGTRSVSLSLRFLFFRRTICNSSCTHWSFWAMPRLTSSCGLPKQVVHETVRHSINMPPYFRVGPWVIGHVAYTWNWRPN
jgi:hypothetical protein